MNDPHPRDLRIPSSAKILLIALLVLAHIFAGTILARRDWAAVLYGYLDRTADAQRLDPHQAIYHKTDGDRLVQGTDPPNLDAAANEYRTTLRLAPCSALHWRDWAYINRRAGRVGVAAKALKAAEFLAPEDHYIQMEIGSLLLDEGRPRDAARHHHHAIQLQPSVAQEIYPLYWKNGWTPATVADNLLSSNPVLLRSYFADCLRQYDPKNVREVWEGIKRARGDVFDATSFGMYFDYLIANKKYPEAENLWRLIVAKFYPRQPEQVNPRNNLFWNGDFQYKDIFDGGLEWRISKNTPGSTHAGISPWRGLTQNDSLWIHFSGEENVSFSQVHHFMFIEPGKTYQLRYHVNALNITTDNGPYVRITVHSDPPLVSKGQVVTNSGDWVLEQEFSVPETAQSAELTICRDSSSKLGNRIKGDIWFDDFTLEVVAGTPSHTEAQDGHE